MQSKKSKFLKKAMEIIDTKPAVFKALEDFETTGKAITKKRMNFTIDKEISKRFREYCRNNHLNMSEIVENFIKKEVAK
jgi:hypothetical protein